jgi:hypothetical protein
MIRFAERVASYVLSRLLSFLPLDLLEATLFRAILRRDFAALPKAKKIETREEARDFVLQVIGDVDKKKILFLEFGVYKGASLKYFSSRITNPESRFYGFDSFEGLPEVWGKNRQGKFSREGQVPVADDGRVEFIKGWFQDSLPKFSIDVSKFDVVLVHLDADLYSSTLFVLSDLWYRAGSFYAVFDEFVHHEARALYSFSKAFPSKIEFLAYDHPASPQRVVCRITKAQSGPTA